MAFGVECWFTGYKLAAVLCSSAACDVAHGLVLHGVQHHRPGTWPDALRHWCLVWESINIPCAVGIALGALLVLTAVLSEPVRVAWRLLAQQAYTSHYADHLACEATMQ